MISLEIFCWHTFSQYYTIHDYKILLYKYFENVLAINYRRTLLGKHYDNISKIFKFKYLKENLDQIFSKY